MQTETNVHAHDLLDLIDAAEPALTVEALIEAVDQRWGASALFCTCSTSNIALTDLMQFLVSHGKVMLVDGKVMLNKSHVCSNHGHDHDHGQKH